MYIEMSIRVTSLNSVSIMVFPWVIQFFKVMDHPLSNMLSRFSCIPTLGDPMECSLPVASVHGFLQQEHWAGLPCAPPGYLHYSGIECVTLPSTVLAGGFFTTSGHTVLIKAEYSLHDGFILRKLNTIKNNFVFVYKKELSSRLRLL